MDYLEALRLVHEIFRPINYCEIGCRSGASLSLSNAPSLAIDPEFHITRQLEAPTRLYRTTSDEFFAHRNARDILGDPISFAFIDGMHLAEYALRDFINLEKAANADSLIAVDDLLPADIAYASRIRQTQMWTGDVYRIVPLLRQYRPDLEIRVYDVPTEGFGLISGLDPLSTVLTDKWTEIEAELAAGAWTLTTVAAIRKSLAPRPMSELAPDLRKLAAGENSPGRMAGARSPSDRSK